MSRKNINIVFNSLFGFCTCIILGLLIFGTNIFNHQSHALQITSFGLTGGIFFSAYKYGTKKEIIFVGCLLFIANLVFLGKPLTLTYFLRDVVFFVSLYCALILYRFFLKKYYYSPKFIRALALALFLGLFNIIATILLILFFSTGSSEALFGMFINGRYGALIGLGLGIGFDLFTKYGVRLLKYFA